MPPFTSEQFHAITRANPECVWNALTATGVPLVYLHEMTADTDWQPGTKVTLALTGQWRLTGEVLAATHVARPARPAHLIQDRSSTVFPLPAGADTTLTRVCAPSRPNSRGRDTTPPAPRPAARSAMRA